ncbi:MAG: tetratricopeptide repeat protein [Bacteroidota bacterium]
MKYKVLFFVVCNFAFSNVFAQNHKIDSLKTLLKTDKADTNKVTHLNKLCWEQQRIGNYDTALALTKQALVLAEKLNYKKGIANSYNNTGIIFMNKGIYPDALKKYFAALKIYDEINHKQGVADTYNNIGTIYAQQGNLDDALKNFIFALKIYEELNIKQDIANSYNNIGVLYMFQANYPESLKNHKAALKTRLEINDKLGIAMSYNNIGINYYDLGNYTDALKNHLAALKLREEIGQKEGIAASYRNIGVLQIKLKKFTDAQYSLNKALQLSKELGSKLWARDTYAGLEALDSTRGNFKGAYLNHKLYIRYRDSLVNEETKEQAIESQMTYDFEKKAAATKAAQDKTNLIAQEEKQKQKLIFKFTLGGLALVLIFLGFVINRFKITQKQKRIIEQQKQLVEEHQKEVIDSITYAKRLQKAILPPRSEIQQNLPHSFVLYKPKDIVAGDFYWADKIENFYFIAAADCTGHGVPGAMVSMVCSSALNRAVNEFGITETGKILDKVRELVVDAFKKSDDEIKDGMDISLCRIDKTNRIIQWSGAHNPLWYFVKNELVELKADKQPIGKYEFAQPFTTHNLELAQGTNLYLFTDGYADQFGGASPLEERAGKKMTKKKMKDLFVSVQDKTMSEQKQILENYFANWKQNTEQVDDVLIIGITV